MIASKHTASQLSGPRKGLLLVALSAATLLLGACASVSSEYGDSNYEPLLLSPGVTQLINTSDPAQPINVQEDDRVVCSHDHSGGSEQAVLRCQTRSEQKELRSEPEYGPDH